MEENLKEKLWAYVSVNNPELKFDLQEEYSVRKYLEEKISALGPSLELWNKQGLPPDEIEKKAMTALTADLKPSKFHYIRDIVRTEFDQTYLKLTEQGTLTYELLNLIDACKEVFEAIGFSEKNKESRRLRDAIIGTIARYLEKLGEE
ncbi:MAG: DUF1896 family protein [Sediminicola sp.]